ncbi:MAG: cobalamin biosynthesis protein [Cocleimonas sp.]|nr:cobalamin biosynthesis protein [Cocleimonas sp.]
MKTPETIIISLTNNGYRLAQQLCAVQAAHHRHKPKPFAATVQQYFIANHPLIFITATGIAVRSLAPVINNKLSDPPVLVMDEQGQFVIPLLSGHEGGANEWAREVSELMNAQLVITTKDAWQQPVYVLGMGCDKGCPESYLQSLIDQYISVEQLPRIVAIASLDLKQKEPALVALSHRLGLPFICYSAERLNTVANKLSYKSEIVYREVGCYGVAEAAALIHAHQLTQQKAELVLIKQKNKRATCALVRSYPIKKAA